MILPLTKPPTADDYNRMAQALRMSHGVMHSPSQSPPPITSNPAVQMIITAEDADYLICNSWDGVIQGSEQYIVAKPQILQQSTLDGTTDSDGNFYTFTGIDAVTVTNGSNTYYWEVFYPYNVGDVIYALSQIRGGVDGVGDYDYLDLNVDGRNWKDVTPVDSRWTPINFTATPLSATTFTSSASGLVVGLPIRYTTVAGGATSYFYAIISAISGTTVTIKGKSLSGATLSAMWLGNPEMVEIFYLQAPGLYAVSTSTTILATFTKTKVPWLFGPAWIVYFIGYVGTLGAGTANVNLTVAGTNVDSSGVTPSTGGVASAAINAPAVAFGNLLEVSVTNSDASSSDLTIAAVAVLE